MKKLAILLSVAIVSFSQAQKQIDQDIQVEKKENSKKIKTDPDARVFILEEQKDALPNNKNVLTKKEILENKKGYKRVNTAINKANKEKRKEERKRLKAQNKMLNKHIKAQRKRERNQYK